MLWELATREVPFADMSPMEVGMKVRKRGIDDITVTAPKLIGSWILYMSGFLCSTFKNVAEDHEALMKLWRR